MTPLRIFRVLGIPLRGVPARTLSSPVNDIIQQPHIYNRTYTEDQLIKYFMDNTVYESSDYIVTSVPQGVRFLPNNKWKDAECQDVCETTLQGMIPKLCKVYNLEYIFVAKHPRRTSSGMLIFAKNFKSFSFLRSHLDKAVTDLKRIYTYLGLVTGSPNETFLKTYRVDQNAVDNNLCTEILEPKNLHSRKMRYTKFGFDLIESSKDGISLLKIKVSYDLRDSVRHILAQRCFTPVFGDFWNVSRMVSFLFGAPIKNTEHVKPSPYTLSPDILRKLNLSEDQQKIIPIHLHLYGMSIPLKRNKEFFVAVPPPESFIWTCNQLELNKIQLFSKGFCK